MQCRAIGIHIGKCFRSPSMRMWKFYDRDNEQHSYLVFGVLLFMQSCTYTWCRVLHIRLLVTGNSTTFIEINGNRLCTFLFYLVTPHRSRYGTQNTFIMKNFLLIFSIAVLAVSFNACTEGDDNNANENVGGDNPSDSNGSTTKAAKLVKQIKTDEGSYYFDYDAQNNISKIEYRESNWKHTTEYKYSDNRVDVIDDDGNFVYFLNADGYAETTNTYGCDIKYTYRNGYLTRRQEDSEDVTYHFGFAWNNGLMKSFEFRYDVEDGQPSNALVYSCECTYTMDSAQTPISINIMYFLLEIEEEREFTSLFGKMPERYPSRIVYRYEEDGKLIDDMVHDITYEFNGEDNALSKITINVEVLDSKQKWTDEYQLFY